MQKLAQNSPAIFLEPNKVQFQRKSYKPGIEDSGVSTSLTAYSIILDDLQTSYVLRAVKAHNGSKALVAPRMTVHDGQHAELLSGEHIPYISGFAEPNESSEHPQPLYDYFDAGTKMEVLPKLTSDANIMLELDLSLSSLVGHQEHLYEDGNEHLAPIVDLVTLSAKATVPDGRTLMMSGGKHYVKTEDERIAEKDLIILIKPTITEPKTIQPEPEESNRPSEPSTVGSDFP